MNYWKYLKPEDLEDPFSTICEEFGVDKFKKLIEMFSGERIHFLKAETIIRLIRNRQISEEFDGTNLIAIAEKHNLSPRQTRDIIRTSR